MAGTNYSVKKLAKMAGVTVRTLHIYDKMGLLKPSVRTDARYRLYGDNELLRLQQVLFYKELDFSLKQIKEILDEPGFNLVKALESHKKAIHNRKDRLNILLKTIDKTILTLKNKTMLNTDELYDGLSREDAAAYRRKAIEKYGQATVERSENYLNKLSKQGAKDLAAQQKEISAQLALLKNEDPASDNVQSLIHQHYLIIRQFWGTAGDTNKQAAAYKGLGNLYVSDERFTMVNGVAQPELNEFLSKAMAYYADHELV